MPNTDPLLHLQNNQKRISQIEGEKFQMRKVVKFRLLNFFMKSIILFTFAMVFEYGLTKVTMMENKFAQDDIQRNTAASKYDLEVATLGRNLFITHAFFAIMRNDMGIRTRFVSFNVLIQYLFIVIRLVTLVAYICDIFPRMCSVIRMTFVLKYQKIDDGDDNLKEKATDALLVLGSIIARCGVIFVLVLIVTGFCFFYFCLKKLRISCQYEWFLKLVWNFTRGYTRQMFIQNKLYEEGFDDDEYQFSDDYIEKYNAQPFPESNYYTFLDLVNGEAQKKRCLQNQFQEGRDCPISGREFKENDRVSVLKCHPMHIYHTESLEMMFQFSNIDRRCMFCGSFIDIKKPKDEDKWENQK